MALPQSNTGLPELWGCCPVIKFHKNKNKVFT